MVHQVMAFKWFLLVCTSFIREENTYPDAFFSGRIKLNMKQMLAQNLCYIIFNWEVLHDDCT